MHLFKHHASQLTLSSALTLLLLFCATRAFAQPLGEVAVVPLVVGAAAASARAAGDLESELSRRQASLVSLHEARDRLNARSRPAQLASGGDVDLLARAAREAVEHVAFGRTAAAQESVRVVIARAERTLESLNRETTTARAILDTCLSLVRSTLQSGKRELALEQAMRCRRLVPDLAPSEATHPVNVVGVLAEADNLLRRLRTGRLNVRSAPESNCSVYLNGRHLGTTPFQLDRAAAGEYRVQVECGRNVGRVHLVQLGDDPVDLWVDDELDRAVRDDPRLTLRYDSLAQAHERAVRHAIQLGRELAVDDVILVAVDRGRAELLRVRVRQGRLVGRAQIVWSDARGFQPAQLEAAVLALAQARLDGGSSFLEDRAPPNGAPPPIPPPAKASDEPAPSALPESARASVAPARPAASKQVQELSVRRKRSGYALLGSASALFAVGVAYEFRTQDLRDGLADFALERAAVSRDPSLARQASEAQDSWALAKKLRWFGAAGGVAALTGSILLVRARTDVPWWSYGIGVVGLSLAAGAIHQLAVSDDCIRSEQVDELSVCRRARDSSARAVMMLGAATSLLAVPLTHLARRMANRELAIVPGAARGALGLTLAWKR